MKKINKYVICILLISLFLSHGALFLAAQSGEKSITTHSDKTEIIDGEVYGCYESIAESVKYLDPPIDDEVFMDDMPWSFVIEVADNWWYSSCYFYKVDGPVKDNYNFIQPENVVELKNVTDEIKSRIKNFASSVALDQSKKCLAVTLRGPYDGNNGRAKFIFRAPKSGNIILYNEGTVKGAAPNSPFKSFGVAKTSGYVELSIMRDEKVISDVVKISADNMETDFPKIGESGRIRVEKGDEVVIYIKSFKNVNENNTVFIDPVIAYTEIFDDNETVNNSLESSPKNNHNTSNGGINLWQFAVLIVVIIVCLSALIVKKRQKNNT